MNISRTEVQDSRAICAEIGFHWIVDNRYLHNRYLEILMFKVQSLRCDVDASNRADVQSNVKMV